MTIGIGLTTHNRRDVLELSLKHFIAFLPPDSKFVIVDDASEEPYESATFRFEENVGIAKAKNKCLELLEDCEHIFIFDDDCYPIKDGWWAEYVASEEPNLMDILKDFDKLHHSGQLKNKKEVEFIFEIIKAQEEY